MPSNSRETYLKLAVAAVVGLFLLDRLVLGPATESWKAQGERLTRLREKVARGRQLLEREASLRGRWKDMQNSNLVDGRQQAEAQVFQAISRWKRESNISFPNLTTQWHTHDNYDSLEFRGSATGDQAALGRLLYEIETDPLPGHVDECELTGRDAQGKQLTLALKFSFVRITALEANPR